MTIELFVFPPSPRAFKVMSLAKHLGVPVELRLLSLRGDQRTADYAALNPNMRMPTLRDGDFVLWEANAILQYLAGRKPESGLLPADERGRLDVTRWQFWDLAHWEAACAVYIFENVVKALFGGIGDPDPTAIARVEQSFRRAARVLDGQLADRRYVTGERLTIADFSIGAPLNLAVPAQLPLGDYPHINRWFAGLSALPAWKQTLAQTAPGGWAVGVTAGVS
jgi:glutathione S-transferase